MPCLLPMMQIEYLERELCVVRATAEQGSAMCSQLNDEVETLASQVHRGLGAGPGWCCGPRWCYWPRLVP